MRLLPLLLLPLLLISCGPDPLYTSRHDFPSGWSYADSLTFAFDVQDTTARYDLELSLAHAPTFPNQNTYVLIDTYFPDGRHLTQPVSLELADRFGRWYGDCNGETCELTVPIQRNARFDRAGAHRLVVRQYARREVLPEVTEVGFRVVPHEFTSP